MKDSIGKYKAVLSSLSVNDILSVRGANNRG